MAIIKSPFGGVDQDLSIVIDSSGSMGEEINTVVDSAVEIVNTLLSGTGSRVSVITYTFDQDIVQSFTGDGTIAISSLQGLGYTGGSTENVMDALIAGFSGDAGPWRDSAQAHRVILFGDEPGDDLTRFNEMVQLSENAVALNGTVDVDVFPVLLGGTSGSFDAETRVSFQKIADGTGGALIEAGDLDEIVDSILSIILTGTQTTVGTASSDQVIGSKGFDTIFAGAGDDTITGDDGSDQIFGGAGNDQAFGGSGNDSMYGGDGDDLIVSGTGSDQIFGGVGGDAIGGGDGDDMLGGGEGGDAAYGAAGADTIYGGGDGGADIAYGGSEVDLVFSGGGADTVAGGSGDDEIGAGAGNDQIASGKDDDLCYGGSGDDTIFAGEGSDTLYGGTGNDQIFVGASDYGRDIVVADANNGNDTVYGFDDYYDRIDLTDTGLTTYSQIEARLTDTAGGNTLLTLDGGSILIVGVETSDLSSYNFTY
ncbi:VWA domain-containing protein [Aurantimonas sp. VKM B-3413]|uniref:VWA domain-containing protein n=1 Tax=Aurantimonas sp. VKM B-3413 TaxID=2779401 RepID=UPI001E4FE9D2|nr:VWA domain-containing protein [Aurantimonas sp. VKM B-3413]MCB8837425.1 VWA domain-containing protein [Aurantimonas sp. VKM B-3413]